MPPLQWYTIKVVTTRGLVDGDATKIILNLINYGRRVINERLVLMLNYHTTLLMDGE